MARSKVLAGAMALAMVPSLAAHAMAKDGGAKEGAVKDGVDAWTSGNYSRAVAQWQEPAAAGDADAQFNLAQAYKLGKGVAPDLKRAEELYRQAAQQGHLQAADTYGLMLFQTGRREAAMPWLVASADRGEPRAQYVLAVAHNNGDLVTKDPVLAYALMTRAAAAGLDVAKSALATMDQTMPIEQRQRGVVLAANLEAKATAQRNLQIASIGLGSKVLLATAPLRPERITAGADYANPVVISAPARVLTPPRQVATVATPVKPLTPAKTSIAVEQAVVAVVPAMASGAWRIQLGAFAVAGNAQGLWAKLKGKPALAGRQAFYVPAGKLTLLRAGPFGSRAEARATCARVGVTGCIPVG